MRELFVATASSAHGQSWVLRNQTRSRQVQVLPPTATGPALAALRDCLIVPTVLQLASGGFRVEWGKGRSIQNASRPYKLRARNPRRKLESGARENGGGAFDVSGRVRNQLSRNQSLFLWVASGHLLDGVHNLSASKLMGGQAPISDRRASLWTPNSASLFVLFRPTQSLRPAALSPNKQHDAERFAQRHFCASPVRAKTWRRLNGRFVSPHIKNDLGSS